jgi:hypothetical protein
MLVDIFLVVTNKSNVEKRARNVLKLVADRKIECLQMVVETTDDFFILFVEHQTLTHSQWEVYHE